MKKQRGVFCFFILYFLFWMGENALSSYLGIFYEAKGLDGVQIAVINSVFSIAVVAAALFAGAIGDQISSTRSLLLALSIAMILGTALLYISASYTMILLSVIIYGVGYSPFNGVADQMLMNRLENHPERFGQIRMGGTIGAGVGVVLAGLLMQHGSRFSALFMIYWTAAALCFLAVLRLPKQAGMKERATWRDYLLVVQHKRFLPIYLTLIVWGLTESSVMQFQALHIVASGYPQAYTSIFIAFAMVGEAIMFALAPKLQKKLGEDLLIGLAFLLQFFRVGTLALVGWIPIYVTTFFQFTGGGAYAAVYSTITQKVSNSFPQSISCSAQNLKLVAYRGVGMTCGLMLIGIFYKEGKSAAAFLILAICALVACLYYAALGVKEKKCVS